MLLRVRGVRAGRILVVTIAILLITFIPFGGRAAAASSLCGATITEDLELDQDLACAGDGLIVGADGVRIDLNDHTIMGPNTATSVGIRVEGRNDVVIKGSGTVEDFETGILVKNSVHVTVKSLSVVHNGHKDVHADLSAGIAVVTSMQVRVKENTAWNNGNAGIFLMDSTEVRVVGNVAGGSHHDGIQLLRSNSNVIRENLVKQNTASNGCGINLIASSFNVIKENRIEDNKLTGIQLPGGSSRNVIRENELARNTNGIRAFAGSLGNLVSENEITDGTNGISFPSVATGNTFRENHIARNVCGIKGSSAALTSNTFIDNEFEANVSDICLV
jgi:parallel beta-helix repeat protein